MPDAAVVVADEVAAAVAVGAEAEAADRVEAVVVAPAFRGPRAAVEEVEEAIRGAVAPGISHAHHLAAVAPATFPGPLVDRSPGPLGGMSPVLRAARLRVPRSCPRAAAVPDRVAVACHPLRRSVLQAAIGDRWPVMAPPNSHREIVLAVQTVLLNCRRAATALVAASRNGHRSSPAGPAVQIVPGA